MKNVFKLLSVAMIAFAMSACGTNNPNAQNGMGYYNQYGQWVPGTGNVTGGNNCITNGQQSLVISFTANAVDFNGNAGFYAGNLPSTHPRGGSHGQVTLGGGVQMSAGSTQISKSTGYGMTTMAINPNARTASGTIQLSGSALYNTGIMNYMYNYQQYPQNGQYNQQQSICVTSVGLDIIYNANYSYGGYQSSPGVITSGLVYLTLSNGVTLPTPVQL